MANMTDAAEVRVNDYLTRGTTPPALTAPMRVQLLSALGVGDAASTPITGGTEAGVVALGAGATASGSGQNSNGAVLRWNGLPNPTTVAGFRILDSAATPFVTLDNIARAGGAATVTDGVFEVAAGGLTASSA